MIGYNFYATTAPSGSRLPHLGAFTITLNLTTLGMTPLDERSARHGDIYLKTNDTHKRRRCPWQDSSSQSRQVSGSKPAP